jgi:hypothetical protein
MSNPWAEPLRGNPWAVIHQARIVAGWENPLQYGEIEKWIARTPSAYFYKPGGISYINGRIYFSDVRFETEEDLFAFKLTFSDIVV